MVWPPKAVASLDMPDAARQQSGLTELTVYWEAGGHPPGAFMTPHFDFHFYTVAPAELAAMDCKDVSKPHRCRRRSRCPTFRCRRTWRR